MKKNSPSGTVKTGVLSPKPSSMFRIACSLPPGSVSIACSAMQSPPGSTGRFMQRGMLRIGPCGSFGSTKVPSGSCGSASPLMWSTPSTIWIRSPGRPISRLM